MLTLAAGQVECLRDAVLPVECGICRRISRGRIGCWPTRRCCADRAGGRRLARHPQFFRRGLCQLGATSFRWWELLAGHTLLGAASDPPGVS